MRPWAFLRSGITFLVGALFGQPFGPAMGVAAGAVAAVLASGTDDDLANDVVATPKLKLVELVKSIFISPKATAAKAVGVRIAPGNWDNANFAELSVVAAGTAGVNTGDAVIAVLEKDDTSKKGSTPMSNSASDLDSETEPLIAGLQDVLNELIATRKPSVSYSSVLIAVESYLGGLTQGQRNDIGAIGVNIDQLTGIITVARNGTLTSSGRQASFTVDTTPAAEDAGFHFDS